MDEDLFGRINNVSFTNQNGKTVTPVRATKGRMEVTEAGRRHAPRAGDEALPREGLVDTLRLSRVGFYPDPSGQIPPITELHPHMPAPPVGAPSASSPRAELHGLAGALRRRWRDHRDAPAPAVRALLGAETHRGADAASADRACPRPACLARGGSQDRAGARGSLSVS